MSQEQQNTKKNKKTLEEQGPYLPLGILNKDGSYTKDLITKKWTFKQEKELGKLREKNENVSLAEYTNSIIAIMYEQIGIHDFTKLKTEEKKFIISQMYMGDVFYAYIWLRKETIGNILDLQLNCNVCKNKFIWKADLNTTEINTANCLQDTLWEYELNEPLTIRNKEVKGFVLSSPRWSATENITSKKLNIGETKASLITSCIQSFLGSQEQIMLVPKEIDEMVKIDIEKLTNLINTNIIGPDMSIEGNCPNCQTQFLNSIDWSYDSFFGFSSQ